MELNIEKEGLATDNSSEEKAECKSDRNGCVGRNLRKLFSNGLVFSVGNRTIAKKVGNLRRLK